MENKKKSLFIKQQKIKPIAIVLFTRHLSTMISAGVPLIKALDSIARAQENITFRTLLYSITHTIAKGESFANALSQHPTVFDTLYCNLIRSAEQSSTLGSMLSRLANHLEKSESLKKKIQTAFTYPLAILAITFIVSGILLIGVVPQFESIFTSFNAPLPPFTRCIILLSRWIQQIGWLFFAILGIIAYWAKGIIFDKIQLRIVLFGPLMRKAIIARITRTLATTLAAGIPLIDALASVSTIAGHSTYKNALLTLREAVISGQALHMAMIKTSLFPILVTQMIAVGEESGALEAMLYKVATYYEDDVDHIVSHLNQLLEPFVMLIMGTLVGCFVIGMYMPLFKLGTIGFMLNQ